METFPKIYLFFTFCHQICHCASGYYTMGRGLDSSQSFTNTVNLSNLNLKGKKLKFELERF